MYNKSCNNNKTDRMVRSTWSSIALGALAAVLSMQSFAVADSSMGGSTQTGFMRDLGYGSKTVVDCAICFAGSNQSFMNKWT